MEHRSRRVSRDTRLLFGIIVVAVATIWVLARIRFPDRVPTPNPMPPVLAQLAPPSAFEDIVSAVSQAGAVVRNSVIAVDVRRRDSSGLLAPADKTAAALRFQDGTAVALMDADTQAIGADVENGVEIARDPATQLALVRVAGGSFSAVTVWSPRQPELPRFLLAADVGGGYLSLRPVFLGSLKAIDSPLWGGRVWNVPGGTNLAPGAFVFNLDGAFAGLAVDRRDGVAIVPAETVVAMAEKLSREGPSLPGLLGLRVQALTPAIGAVTGASAGVVVTWIDPEGPAASHIRVTDVIESFGDEPVLSLEHWEARAARVQAGELVALAVRSGDVVRHIEIAAARQLPDTASRGLGLTLRTIPGTGAAVVSVDPRSAAHDAGIAAGDVITVLGDRSAPTAAEVSRTYQAAPEGARLLAGITRGRAHHVVVLERMR